MGLYIKTTVGSNGVPLEDKTTKLTHIYTM